MSHTPNSSGLRSWGRYQSLNTTDGLLLVGKHRGGFGVGLQVLPHSQSEREPLGVKDPDAESAPHRLLLEYHSQVTGERGGVVPVVLFVQRGPVFVPVLFHPPVVELHVVQPVAGDLQDVDRVGVKRMELAHVVRLPVQPVGVQEDEDLVVYRIELPDPMWLGMLTMGGVCGVPLEWVESSLHLEWVE